MKIARTTDQGYTLEVQQRFVSQLQKAEAGGDVPPLSHCKTLKVSGRCCCCCCYCCCCSVHDLCAHRTLFDSRHPSWLNWIEMWRWPAVSVLLESEPFSTNCANSSVVQHLL